MKILALMLFSLFLSTGCGRYRVKKENNSYSHHMHTAHSMEDLDNQSKNTQPMLLYSYAKKDTLVNEIAPIKYKILNYINSVRSKGNTCGDSAPPLGWNTSLENAALAHAVDMEQNKFLGHMGSGTEFDSARKGPGNGSNFYERILHYGYPVKPGELAGEIISYTKYRIVGSQEPYANFTHAIDNFLKSPKHCSILMNSRFHDVGIAAYKDQEKIYWVIEFAEVSY